MDQSEKAEIIHSLQSSLDTLLLSIKGLTEESARRKPAAGKWSVLECMEHLALAEDHMFGQLASASKMETPQLNRGREALIRRRAADRTHKIEAPDVARPKGTFSTLADASQHFLASRRRTMDFVQNGDTDLRAMMTIHPILGPVNCYEMLLIMSAHPLRHSQQIQEIRNP
jgi:hypothetical protein